MNPVVLLWLANRLLRAVTDKGTGGLWVLIGAVLGFIAPFVAALLYDRAHGGGGATATFWIFTFVTVPLGVLLGWMVQWFIDCVRFYRAEPTAEPVRDVAGWLKIPILVLLVQIVLAAYNLFSLGGYLRRDAWATVSAPDSCCYSPAGLALISFNLITNLFAVIFAFCLLRLVRERSARVPGWFVVFLLCYPAILLTEWGLAANAGVALPRDLLHAAFSVVHAAIWVPYFRISKRVAETFGIWGPRRPPPVEWFYMDGDRGQGPVSSAKIARLVEQGRITGKTFVRFGSMTRWLSLEEAATICPEKEPTRFDLKAFLVPLSLPAAAVLLGLVLLVAATVFFPASVAGPGRNANRQAFPSIGDYSQIDTRDTKSMAQALCSPPSKYRQRLIAFCLSRPERFAPPVLFELSRTLFKDGRRDEAAFWFHASQLRTRFDANRCADVSARQAVAALKDEHGIFINQHMLRHPSGAERLIQKVVEWDRKTPHHYDHRWVNLHGMTEATAGLNAGTPNPGNVTFSLPEAQWDAIAEQTRTEYLAEFRKAIAATKGQESRRR